MSSPVGFEIFDDVYFARSILFRYSRPFRPTQPGHPSVSIGAVSILAMVSAITGEETASYAYQWALTSTAVILAGICYLDLA